MENKINLKARIELIKQPEKIKDALYANSPAVLGFMFDVDPNVRAVIGAQDMRQSPNPACPG